MQGRRDEPGHEGRSDSSTVDGSRSSVDRASTCLHSRPALSQYLRKEVFQSPEKVDAARLEHYYRSSHQPGTHAPLAAYLSGYLNHKHCGSRATPQSPSLACLGTPCQESTGRERRPLATSRPLRPSWMCSKTAATIPTSRPAPDSASVSSPSSPDCPTDLPRIARDGQVRMCAAWRCL